MPTWNRSVRPPKTNPANARQIRSQRRRTRLNWIWFSLVVAVVAIGYGIFAAVQYHARQVARAAAEAEENAIEQRANDAQPDGAHSANTSASVTPLNSTVSLVELLDRSWDDSAAESE